MDLETFAVQRFTLALAIGIVKSKPPYLSACQHLSSLKSKLKEDDFSDIEINDEDFNCCDDGLENTANEQLNTVDSYDMSISHTITGRESTNIFDDSLSVRLTDAFASECQYDSKLNSEPFAPLLSGQIQLNEQDGLGFKVLFSLETVKKYLSKTEERYPDSGFREMSRSSSYSDFQQMETEKLNEAGNTLITYIENCKFEELSKELCLDIAENVATFIDTLHAKDVHMNFMGSVLEVVSGFIEKMLENSNTDVEMFISKQAYFLKLTLLNKSANISVYTIKTLIKKMHYFYDTLTSDSEKFYDLTGNIDDVETSHYMFEALKVLLSNHKSENVKSKKTFEDMEISSDEEMVTLSQTKKLMNLWRSKWVASAEEKIPKSRKKDVNMDVLTDCGALLSKFIVNCTEKYPLIAFAALQCYNILQSRKTL